MSRLAKRHRSAAARGCYAFRRGSWPIFDTDLEKWGVYVDVEGGLGPRGLSLTRRQAVILAKAISVAGPAPQLEVVVADAVS